jgi:hypothetical protein
MNRQPFAIAEQLKKANTGPERKEPPASCDIILFLWLEFDKGKKG